jgi:RNA polymerase sigma-70 factor (ECF subfamily)
MDPSSLHTTQLHGWLDRLDAGDLQAREELLRNVGKRLERLAHKMLGRFPTVRGWADSGDVVQNATLRLLRALKQVRPATVRDFFGLAAEQMRRELVDLARQASRGRRLGLASAAPPGSPDETLVDFPAIDDDDDDLELWEQFHNSVATLPDEEREVVSLIYYHGWSQQRVGQLMRMAERTVRRRWRTACLRLRDRLNGRLPGHNGTGEAGR